MADSINRSLDKADALVRARGVVLTPVRRRVLELILEARHPVGAYALLASLQSETGKAMQNAAMTVDLTGKEGTSRRVQRRDIRIFSFLSANLHPVFISDCRS